MLNQFSTNILRVIQAFIRIIVFKKGGLNSPSSSAKGLLYTTGPIFCMRIHQHAVMPPHPAFKPSVPPPNAADTTCLQLKPPFQYVELLRNREHFIVMKRSFFSTFNMCVNNKWMAVQKKKKYLYVNPNFPFLNQVRRQIKFIKKTNTQKFLHSGFVVVAKRNCRFSVEMGNSHFEDESIKTVAWLCLEKNLNKYV